MEKIFMMKKINEEDTKKINEEDEQRKGFTCTCKSTHACTLHCIKHHSFPAHTEMEISESSRERF